MSSKNLFLFFDCVYVLNKVASQISRINLLNLLLIRQHLMNRQLMFQLQVTTLKMNHRNSRLKQLHQHLRQHHLLTTQRTKRVQTQTIKYQKKTEQLHYVETQSFSIQSLRAIVNKRTQIYIFLFARIGYNFLIMNGTKKTLEENDIIHLTLSLLPLLNRKLVQPYKPELPKSITTGLLQVLLVLSAEGPIRMQEMASELGINKQQLNARITSKEEITEDMIERCLPYSEQLPQHLKV